MMDVHNQGGKRGRMRRFGTMMRGIVDQGTGRARSRGRAVSERFVASGVLAHGGATVFAPDDVVKSGRGRPSTRFERRERAG